MSYQIINLTLWQVTTEIDNVLVDYPEHPYQVAFTLPNLRQQLLDYVLNSIPNRYEIIEDEYLEELKPNFRHVPLEERLQIENLIRAGIVKILQENSESVSSLGCQPES